MKDNEIKYKLTKENGSKLGPIVDVIRLRGVGWAIRYSALTAASLLLGQVWDIHYKSKYNSNRLSSSIFKFEGISFKYFIHPYNNTWRHERALEIPIARYYLSKIKTKNVLEVGNVLSNYFNVSHTIVDNYEIAKGVINEDVMDFLPKKKFGLIVSVSTMEHVGVDGVKEEGKAIKAIRHLYKLLDHGGTLIFTVPVGYNPALDQAIRDRNIKLDKTYYFKKVSRNNKWLQVKEEEIKKSLYGFPFRWGNALTVAVVKKV